MEVAAKTTFALRLNLQMINGKISNCCEINIGYSREINVKKKRITNNYLFVTNYSTYYILYLW